ncbi:MULTISPECIES: ABC transporter permease [unclassified Beijerinckia]|uniref:ABC transporter permease n=1 Tax=unclassified Beijerinckia TaxID=2638183 RepID=UPI00089A5CC8|nr:MULTISPECIES: ABC transporter permease [unclassified Beijerinckia]MDH7798822.1 peptide/nickel transport system permease protein [Beijerinckia sp. GAS462]SED89747.1 peptide/nickel transport system permease protein [Beijerinckia sp. 28-YEA-48]
MSTTLNITNAASAKPKREPKVPRSNAGSAAGIVGAIVLAIVIVASVAAPLITSFDPNAQQLANRLLAPFSHGSDGLLHLLGTDQYGRDIFTRILYGGRVSLSIGLVTASMAAVIGIAIGLLGGFREGRLGAAVRGILDIQTAFPFLVIAIAVVGVIGANVLTIIVVLTLWTWLPFARLSFTLARSLKHAEYVKAARSAGAGDGWILRKHLLPNMAPALLVVWTFVVAQVIIAESGLSFLGLGIQPPTSTWGSSVSDGRDYISTAWWVAIVPGMVISIVTLAVNLVGDALRDRFDPQLQVGA